VLEKVSNAAASREPAPPANTLLAERASDGVARRDKERESLEESIDALEELAPLEDEL
jgi:hypothetical protein